LRYGWGLASNIGDRTGWLGFSYGSPITDTMTSAGYPGDKPFGSLWQQQNPTLNQRVRQRQADVRHDH
jgi:V8-like Glu-specific endopeptidase